MAKNMVNKRGEAISFVPTSPTSPVSGSPVRLGEILGVAMDNPGAGGNAAGAVSVWVGPGVFSLSVTDSQATGIALGDKLYFTDGNPPVINNDNTKRLFGYALGTVGANATATINVPRHVN